MFCLISISVLEILINIRLSPHRTLVLPWNDHICKFNLTHQYKPKINRVIHVTPTHQLHGVIMILCDHLWHFGFAQTNVTYLYIVLRNYTRNGKCQN